MRLSLSCILVIVAPLFGAETKVALRDAPAAVQKAVQAQTKSAAIAGLTKEVENGKTVYELETKANGRSKDIIIGSDGSILSVEEEVALDSIPAPAKAAIEKKAAGGKISKVEAVTEGGKLSYEATIVTKGKESEVKVAADGSVMK